jgi:hypothetical protein
MKVCCGFESVWLILFLMTFFCCVVAFVELLGLVGAFFSIYEIIWLFVLSCRTLCEMAMMGMK